MRPEAYLYTPFCNINKPRLHHAVSLSTYLEIAENPWTAISQSSKNAWSAVWSDAKNSSS